MGRRKRWAGKRARERDRKFGRTSAAEAALEAEINVFSQSDDACAMVMEAAGVKDADDEEDRMRAVELTEEGLRRLEALQPLVDALKDGRRKSRLIEQNERVTRLAKIVQEKAKLVQEQERLLRSLSMQSTTTASLAFFFGCVALVAYMTLRLSTKCLGIVAVALLAFAASKTPGSSLPLFPEWLSANPAVSFMDGSWASAIVEETVPCAAILSVKGVLGGGLPFSMNIVSQIVVRVCLSLVVASCMYQLLRHRLFPDGHGIVHNFLVQCNAHALVLFFGLSRKIRCSFSSVAVALHWLCGSFSGDYYIFRSATLLFATNYHFTYVVALIVLFAYWSYNNFIQKDRAICKDGDFNVNISTCTAGGSPDEVFPDGSDTVGVAVSQPTPQCDPHRRQKGMKGGNRICGGCCANLKGKPRKICKGCLSVCYCDRNCQKRHWNRKRSSHRDECSDLKKSCGAIEINLFGLK